MIVVHFASKKDINELTWIFGFKPWVMLMYQTACEREELELLSDLLYHRNAQRGIDNDEIAS